MVQRQQTVVSEKRKDFHGAGNFCLLCDVSNFWVNNMLLTDGLDMHKDQDEKT